MKFERIIFPKGAKSEYYFANSKGKWSVRDNRGKPLKPTDELKRHLDCILAKIEMCRPIIDNEESKKNAKKYKKIRQEYYDGR